MVLSDSQLLQGVGAGTAVPGCLSPRRNLGCFRKYFTDALVVRLAVQNPEDPEPVVINYRRPPRLAAQIQSWGEGREKDSKTLPRGLIKTSANARHFRAQ